MDLAYDHLGTISEAETSSNTANKEGPVPVAIKNEPTTVQPPYLETTTDGPTADIESTTDSAGSTTAPLSTSKPSDKVEQTFNKAADKLENSVNDVYARMTTAASAASATSWGSTLGGFWSKAKKQGEAAIKVAVKEFEETKLEFTELKNEIDEILKGDEVKKVNQASPEINSVASEPKEKEVTEEATDLSRSTETLKARPSSEGETAKPKAQGMLSLLANKAQQYIDDLDKDLEKLENKAGETLLQMGTGFQGYIKDAITITGPSKTGDTGANSDAFNSEFGSSEVLFSVPEDIRKQIYSTRLDAQLHALHTTKEPFLVNDTASVDTGYAEFVKSFDVDAHTETIAKDLDKYPQLRTLMESLVPDSVAYNEFWTRYYFMRSEISDQEEKRKALLQSQVSNAEEELNWDDDDEDEEDDQAKDKKVKNPVTSESTSSTETLSKSSGTFLSSEKKPIINTTSDASTPITKPLEDIAGPAVPSDSVESSPRNVPISSRPSSESSYDLISKTSSVVDLSASAVTAAIADATGQAKSNNQKPVAEESDSDDDWE